ncbi:hypothetical protein ACFQZE_23895 [Paenibacillus sp. GCM10027627]|uniref:hypothetical protein n=1 Tax=unclassified Paenibacillus TaxID=185978 RepID=UPI003642812E
MGMQSVPSSMKDLACSLSQHMESCEKRLEAIKEDQLSFSEMMGWVKVNALLFSDEERLLRMMQLYQAGELNPSSMSIVKNEVIKAIERLLPGYSCLIEVVRSGEQNEE